jgi:WD40 repeat protein
MRTQREIEGAICDGIRRFGQDYMGRGPSKDPKMRRRLFSLLALYLQLWPVPATSGAESGGSDLKFVSTGDYKGKTVRLETSPDNKLAFKPDGRFGRLVETAGGKPVGPAIDAGTMWTEHHARKFSCWTFSPDGRYLVTGSSFMENSGSHGGERTDVGRIQVWDLRTWKEVDQSQGRMGGIKSVKFSEDGKQIIYSARPYEIDGP